jgi:hypothetical protein
VMSVLVTVQVGQMLLILGVNLTPQCGHRIDGFKSGCPISSRIMRLLIVIMEIRENTST